MFCSVDVKYEVCYFLFLLLDIGYIDILFYNIFKKNLNVLCSYIKDIFVLVRKY